MLRAVCNDAATESPMKTVRPSARHDGTDETGLTTVAVVLDDGTESRSKSPTDNTSLCGAVK